mmetsp:Transcript_66093/g.186764  ORF Transcript_66093/g.186764 Transcript_66093/m.186764 type:complete len:543 (+) Transcript_66093:342-1970(+)
MSFPRMDNRPPPPQGPPAVEAAAAGAEEDPFGLPDSVFALLGAPGGGSSEVLLQVSQRRARGASGVEVRRGADGEEEIPLSVCATTVSTRIPREVLMRSPWLSRCMTAPDGVVQWRSLGGEENEEAPAEEDVEEAFGGSSPSRAGRKVFGGGTGVTCRRSSNPEALELGLPLRGAGRFLAPSGALQCLEIAAPQAVMPFNPASLPSSMLLSHFLWAAVLELTALAAACRQALVATVDAATVAFALAAGHATEDEDLLRRCYWCLRETMCGATGVPSMWLDCRGPVKLAHGLLSHSDGCGTPLRVLSGVLEQDLEAKKQQWHTPFDGYTLCQVHRFRGQDGAYPHTYEMRLDHSDEVVMKAIREDEQSLCRIFAKSADPVSASEHCEEYLGSVVPNFWGTVFTLRDSGTDVDALARRAKDAMLLPLRPQSSLCTIGYETNLLGDCPRKISVDFQRGGTKYHMENMQPRWDKKLNSYALPFFGRVKKASAKNFQLVINNDQNTIFLMFGKISKDVFCLDYRGPISHLDAMAIALAALAKKRAVS